MKNIDYINKIVADKLGVPLETVEKVNSHYWNTVKQAMRSLEDEYIYVKEIGTFAISNFKIDRHIRYIRDYIRNIRNSPRFTDSRKEKLIRYYKDRYANCMKMKRLVDASLHYKKTYKKCLPK